MVVKGGTQNELLTKQKKLKKISSPRCFSLLSQTHALSLSLSLSQSKPNLVTQFFFSLSKP